ncbi:MAG: hypothetical protein K5851_08860 [Lachnospiraceae bacterium]|nr:hypothetical protein [Lachnospiraceae bacterium]
MEELRVLFIHPETAECDAFRRTCLDEDFKVETVPSIEEARILLKEYTYEMVFLNRKYDPEDIINFIEELNERFPNTVCVMGVQTLTKGDLIHYQNSNVSYRMYLEPVNYRVDLLPLIQNTMLQARARIIEASDAGAKKKEKAWKTGRNIMLSLIPESDSEDGSDFLRGVLDKYHKISMSSITRIQDFLNENKELFRTYSNLTINFNVTESARRVLEYTDSQPKLNLTRVMTMILCEESRALASGYKVTCTVTIDMSRNGPRVTAQSMLSNKPGTTGNEYSTKNKIIRDAADGISNDMCELWDVTDDFPAGMWMHTRDVVFDA